MKRLLSALAPLAAATFMVLALPQTASAAAPAQGTYALHNHPDGGAALPYYGLRLDELINVNFGASDSAEVQDIFTFDFDHASSNMQLVWDGSFIEITGTAYGGLDTGTGYTNPLYAGLWAIDFTYDTGISTGSENIKVVANGANGGSITSLFSLAGLGLHQFNLVDKSNGTFSFKFGHEDGGGNHRGFDGISGWGWLNHSGAGLGTHVGASDWLFTATPVPEPEIYAMLGLGMGLMGFLARRRKKKYDEATVV